MSSFHAFVDRVEGGGAVLEALDDSFSFALPASVLPDGVGEGDVVEFDLSNDPERREQEHQEVQELQNQLIETPDDD